MTLPGIRMEPLDESNQSGLALEALLTESYVGGGFTSAQDAATMFRAAAVRARGTVLTARDETGALLGCIILVAPGSPALRLAGPGEAELHLLCVRPTRRAGGLGGALVTAALERARALGVQRVVLWTQQAMTAAQGLYARMGFQRLPDMDFSRGGRNFLVYRLELVPADRGTHGN